LEGAVREKKARTRGREGKGGVSKTEKKKTETAMSGAKWGGGEVGRKRKKKKKKSNAGIHGEGRNT